MSIIGDIFKDKTLGSLLDRVDTLINSLQTQKVITSTSSDNTTQTIKEFITSETQNDPDINQIFSNIVVPAERLNRYIVYDELYKTIQLVKKILIIYQNYILQKDLVSGKILLYKPSNQITTVSDEEYKAFEQFIDRIIQHYNIREQLKNRIIPFLLRYGDYFVEIIDLMSTEIDIPRPDTQSVKNIKYLESLSKSQKINENDFQDVITELICEIDDSKEIDQELLSETSSLELEDITDPDLRRIVLRFHRPHNVVIIKTHNDEIIGYLVVYEKENTTAVALSPTYRFATIISQLAGMDRSDVNNLDSLTDKLLMKLVKKIINKSNIQFEDDNTKSKKENEYAYQQYLYQSLKPNLFYTLKELLINIKEKNSITNKLKVRFVPLNKMVQFTLPNSEYYPYGMSLIDPIVYPAKLYLLHQLSNIVIKLSRAAVIRKWTIETGPRDIHSGLLNKLKQEFRNQRITVDDVMSFRSIPKVLSDFKDLVLFSKKGQKFLDVEVQTLEDPNAKVSDLEDARRELISLSGVPAAYLGFSEITELRDALISININFAMDISSHQENVCQKLNELIDKIFAILYPNLNIKPSNIVTIYITPPTVLMLQVLEATMGSITNILTQTQAIKGITIDPKTLLKQYIPFINWDEIIEKGAENITKQLAKEQM